MIKGVIFDLDGVLVSTDELHFHSWEKLAAEEGFTFYDREFNHKFRGIARMKCVDILTEASGRSYTREQKRSIAERKNRYLVDMIETLTPEALLPGSRETLAELRRRGIKIAVASNSRNARPIIERVGIKHLLDVVVDGYDIVNSKPHPEVFLLAAKRLGLSPPECLVVEDAVAGIEAAQAAGMASLGIGARDYLPNAPVLVKNLAEIAVDTMLSLGNE